MIDLEVPVEGVALDALDTFLSSPVTARQHDAVRSRRLSDCDRDRTRSDDAKRRAAHNLGYDEPVFTDEAEAQIVLGGILSRYNTIHHEIANGIFEPILWSDVDGTVIGTDWAEGFMQNVGLRATKWDQLFKSEDGAGLIFPILALCGDENGESLLGLEPEDEDRIAVEAATLFAGCAMAIDDYWRQQKLTHGATNKPGRNDPCSCGSGINSKSAAANSSM